jgi:hypothetical protein
MDPLCQTAVHTWTSMKKPHENHCCTCKSERVLGRQLGNNPPSKDPIDTATRNAQDMRHKSQLSISWLNDNPFSQAATYISVV